MGKGDDSQAARNKNTIPESVTRKPKRWQGLALHAVHASSSAGSVWRGVSLPYTSAMSKGLHILLPFIRSLVQAMSQSSSCISRSMTAVRLQSHSPTRHRPGYVTPYMVVSRTYLLCNSRLVSFTLLFDDAPNSTTISLPFHCTIEGISYCLHSWIFI